MKPSGLAAERSTKDDRERTRSLYMMGCGVVGWQEELWIVMRPASSLNEVDIGRACGQTGPEGVSLFIYCLTGLRDFWNGQNGSPLPHRISDCRAKIDMPPQTQPMKYTENFAH